MKHGRGVFLFAARKQKKMASEKLRAGVLFVVLTLVGILLVNNVRNAYYQSKAEAIESLALEKR